MLLVLIFSTFFGIIDSAPALVTTDDYALDFQDHWNHKIKPHGTPLLNESTKNHILPDAFSMQKLEKKFNSVITKKVKDRTSKKLGDAVRSRVSCPVCKLVVGLLAKEIKKGTKFEDIQRKFINLCVAFKIESEDVCTGIFNVYGPEVVPALSSARIGPTEICSMVLGETCGDVDNPLHEWQVEFTEKLKPSVAELQDPPIKNGLPTFKVLHITDTHYDPFYVVDSPSNCLEPLCCRSNSTPPTEETLIPAGRWGSYSKCDSPKILIEHMLKSIAEEHPDIDYIIWTGDLPPHDIWNQTRDSNLGIILDTVQQMFEIFPNTPIFPALGNHESIPPGSFPPPWVHHQNHSIYWLYRELTDLWRIWLPASSINSLLHGAFYSVLIRPGFRLISLNTNYCHTLNWWLMVNSTDPAKELQWLIHELQAAEDNGEKVHIIGHIAPGSSDCMKVWSRNFYAIIDRFESTILAQFYGHSHADEFEVFYDVQENSRPTGVAYLGPSVTTYDHYNPAYRIYYVDGDHENTTRDVIDHETWTMDLDEANKNDNEPKWYKLYSARNAYGMDSLRPREWAKLIDRMVDDSDLFDMFYKFYYRDSPTRPPCTDSTCKLQILCDLKSGRSHSRHELCHDLELAFGR